MNRYPIWWDKKVTVFNKYEDPTTNLIEWYKYIVEDCFWKYVGEKITVGKTTLETNNTICRMPKNENYLESYEWKNLTRDEKQNHFTLKQGDILILGEVKDDIDEYVKGYRSTDIISKYKQLQGCFLVEKVANNTGNGRANEHYYISGV